MKSIEIGLPMRVSWNNDMGNAVAIATVITIGAVIIVVLILLGAAVVKRHFGAKAWQEGYQRCLETHGMTMSDIDMPALTYLPNVTGPKEEAWRDGYETCLSTHELSRTPRDARELASNPYASFTRLP